MHVFFLEGTPVWAVLFIVYIHEKQESSICSDFISGSPVLKWAQSFFFFCQLQTDKITTWSIPHNL